MILTPNQIELLMQIIDRYQVLFIAQHVGTEVLSIADKAILKSAGIDIDKILKPGQEDFFTTAFKFGILSDALGDERAKKMKYAQFVKFLEKGDFIPLTSIEKESLLSVKHQAYNDIKGLGNKIKQHTYTTIIEADQKQRVKYEKIIQTEAARTIRNRETVKDMVSRIGHKSQDWTRDFGRISDFILHSAFLEGKAANIAKEFGEEAKVYKRVFNLACKNCIRAYMTKGLGSKPRLFTIAELRANGSNIGRKVEDWKPVISAHHPFCRCEIVFYDPAYEWNKKENTFNILKPFKRQVQRKSKIIIQIDDKTYKV